MQLDLLIDGIDFGEGPRWHDGRLWYSDFFQHAVYAVTPAGARERIVEVPQQPSGLGWLPDGRLLVVSMLDRRLLRLEEGGHLVEHADLSPIATGPCNDMVVSATGHAYIGNFGAPTAGGPPEAALAHVTPDGCVAEAARGLRFPNGSVITPDGRTLIVAETAGAALTAFDIRDDGGLANSRTWAALDAHPDGIALDAAGAIWLADPGGRRVVRVLEGGEVTHALDTEDGAYACALGGPDRRTLYILTAPGFTAEDCAGKHAGRILHTRVDIPGAGLP
ncbi:MAG: SMP-30/gluconolactonase/LRE family protein [Dehalococcoidia bacterium]